MSQRTNRVESLIHQIVAAELTRLPAAARLTVTGVQVSPDLRQATVWVGALANSSEQAESLFESAEENRDDIQAAVAKRLTTKFIPRLTLRRDTGGEYADHINR